MTPPEGPTTAERFQRLVEVVHALRVHCPWTSEQTHASIAPYAAEEAEEIAEAVAALEEGTGTGRELADELGDLLLQVVLQAEIGSEAEAPERRVSLDAVIEAITAKLVRRSPHVFAEDGSVRVVPMSIAEIDAQWDAIKAQERGEGAETGR
ncbi:MazG nucleotide pyrophosphohydrolase domain-containing protein [Arthrobacter sp. UM1]|uniref:MazG nucleotide pyrophosphohydrolase domain-containing protein n=1 Tax=Arthrobacter sp. UM1 TaxID=2766776 RepID=UPI001CF6BA2D|nr:MazG nucleotide pyrophosphohydrolase domain-containing protein [Arthrobacter sp. UM1]MCB4207939.1 hypothetical protein [Arthrobacter sp. UM1]